MADLRGMGAMDEELAIELIEVTAFGSMRLQLPVHVEP
jgi:hypothetical protein